MLQAWYNANLSQLLGTDSRHAPERSTPWSTPTTVRRPLLELAKYCYSLALTVASKKLSPLPGFGRDTTVSTPPSLAGDIICTKKFCSGDIVRNHRQVSRVDVQRRKQFHLSCAHACIAHALSNELDQPRVDNHPLFCFFVCMVLSGSLVTMTQR